MKTVGKVPFANIISAEGTSFQRKRSSLFRGEQYLHSLANLHIFVHISNLNFSKTPLIRTKNTSTAWPQQNSWQTTCEKCCKIHFTFRKLSSWQTTCEKYYKAHFTFCEWVINLFRCAQTKARDWEAFKNISPRHGIVNISFGRKNPQAIKTG